MANNLIQIKRSTTTAANSTAPSLQPGELAYSQLNQTLFIGAPDGTTNIRIGGQMSPGVLTANQALVANATSGIDKVIVANLVTTAITANSSQGSAGQYLTSNGAGGVYWTTPTSGVSGSNTQVQYNNSGVLAGATGLTFDNTTNNVTIANNLLVTVAVNAASHTVGTSTIANATGVYTTGTVNAATIQTGTTFIANSTQVTIGAVPLFANSAAGTAGHVLHTNGTGVYWAADDNSGGTVTSVATGNGMTGGTITTTGTVSVLANNGIIANATGVYVRAGNSISVDVNGVNVVGNSGITSNTTGLFINSGNGIAVGAGTTGAVRVVAGNSIAVDTNGVRVVAGNSQLISNTTGLFIDQSRIDHDSLLNYVANKHVDHSTVTLTAGNGLTGGGDITASRSFAVGAGNGITVGADDVAVLANSGLTSNATGVFVNAGNGITVAAGAGGTVSVNGGSTLTVNATGVHVNSTLAIQDLALSGNLTVSGTITTVDTTTLKVKDNLIELASQLANSAAFLDNVDTGFFVKSGNTTNNFYSGMARVAGSSTNTNPYFKLFSTASAVNNTIIDTTANTGTLQAFLLPYGSGGAFVVNAANVNIVANNTVGVNITANSVTLGTPLAVGSGGTGLSTVASWSLLYGNSTGPLGALALGTSGRVLQSNGTAIVYDTLDGGTF